MCTVYIGATVPKLYSSSTVLRMRLALCDQLQITTTLTVHSHRAKVEANAKIYLDVCRFFSDLACFCSWREWGLTNFVTQLKPDFAVNSSIQSISPFRIFQKINKSACIIFRLEHVTEFDWLTVYFISWLLPKSTLCCYSVNIYIDFTNIISAGTLA